MKVEMIKGKNVMNPAYIVGLTDGEGCFLVCLRKDYRIELRFFITQAIGNVNLLRKVHQYFKVGSVYQKKSAKDGRLPAYVFEVAKRDDIYKVIIPFFKKHKLLGTKAKSFKVFCKVAKIIKGRQDMRKLTKKELTYIRRIRLGMNKHYGSPGAENPLAEVGTRNNLNEAQSVKSVKLGAPESRLYREKVTLATKIKS